MRVKLLLVFLVLLVGHFGSGATFAQTDTELIESARRGIEQNACSAARNLLQRVIDKERKDWVLLMARSYECTESLADLRNAVTWYEKYAALRLDDVEKTNIEERLADLRYRARKRGEAEMFHSALIRDLTGLWKQNLSDDIVLITQRDGRVSGVMTEVSLDSRIKRGWKEGDLVFEGTMNEDEATLTMHFRYNQYHPDRGECSPKVTFTARFRVKEDYRYGNDGFVYLEGAFVSNTLPRESDCGIADWVLRWTKLDEDGNIMRVTKL